MKLIRRRLLAYSDVMSTTCVVSPNGSVKLLELVTDNPVDRSCRKDGDQQSSYFSGSDRASMP